MEFCKFEIVDGEIAVITFCRPPANALNIASKDELAELFKSVNAREDISCVILKSEGKGFMSGSDVKEFSALTHETLDEVQAADKRLFKALGECKVPTIAAVHGYCLALGLVVASSCDLLVASDDAFFGTPEIKVGITGGASEVCQIVPEKLARYMAFTGNYLSAEDLYPYGGIFKVVKKDALYETALSLAHEITANYYKAVQYVKEGMSQTNDFHALDKYTIECKYGHLLLDDPNRDELLRAFSEKRKPVFNRK